MIGGPTNLFQNLLAGALLAGTGVAVNQGLKGIQSQRREEGKSGLLGGRPGEMTREEMQKQLDYIKGVSSVGVQNYGAMSPIMNQNAELAMQRQMQLNQQLGQITGGLNQQKYTAQLAGGAQQQQTQMLDSMLRNQNPYAASAFNPNVNVSY